jgi:hypothetical protein
MGRQQSMNLTIKGVNCGSSSIQTIPPRKSEHFIQIKKHYDHFGLIPNADRKSSTNWPNEGSISTSSP